MSFGVFGQILNRFWHRNDSLAFWNATELAIYELEDGWFDCRRQSLQHESTNQLTDDIMSKMYDIVAFEKCAKDFEDSGWMEINAMKGVVKHLYAIASGQVQRTSINQAKNETNIHGKDVMVH